LVGRGAVRERGSWRRQMTTPPTMATSNRGAVSSKATSKGPKRAWPTAATPSSGLATAGGKGAAASAAARATSKPPPATHAAATRLPVGLSSRPPDGNRVTTNRNSTTMAPE
jgi:hypothetical protein